jgi:hypothetical protein
MNNQTLASPRVWITSGSPLWRELNMVHSQLEQLDTGWPRRRRALYQRAIRTACTIYTDFYIQYVDRNLYSTVLTYLVLRRLAPFYWFSLYLESSYLPFPVRAALKGPKHEIWVAEFFCTIQARMDRRLRKCTKNKIKIFMVWARYSSFYQRKSIHAWPVKKPRLLYHMHAWAPLTIFYIYV